MAVDNFSDYRVFVSVWLADSSHAVIVLKINMCHVFSFLDHFQSYNGVPFIIKVTEQWADGQGIWRTFHVPYHPQVSVIVDLLKNHLRKIYHSIFLTFYWSMHLSKALLSLNLIFSTEGSSSLSSLLENNQDKWGRGLSLQCPILKIQDCTLAIPEHDVSFFPPTIADVVDKLPRWQPGQKGA